MTLIECIIVMGVMTVILGATHAFLSGGVSFYQNSVQGLEVQQQALVGLTRMSKELVNTNFDKSLVEGSSIVFPTVINANGEYASDDNGNPLWCAFVCYLAEPEWMA